MCRATSSRMSRVDRARRDRKSTCETVNRTERGFRFELRVGGCSAGPPRGGARLQWTGPARMGDDPDVVRLRVRHDERGSHWAARQALLALALVVAGPLSAAGQPVSDALRRQIDALLRRQGGAIRRATQALVAADLRRPHRARPAGGAWHPHAAHVARSRCARRGAGRHRRRDHAGVAAATRRLGGVAIASLPARRALRARLPLAQVEALAALPEVVRIREADPAFTNKVDTSEGDGAHYADDARANLGVDGSGVTRRRALRRRRLARRDAGLGRSARRDRASGPDRIRATRGRRCSRSSTTSPRARRCSSPPRSADRRPSPPTSSRCATPAPT